MFGSLAEMRLEPPDEAEESRSLNDPRRCRAANSYLAERVDIRDDHAVLRDLRAVDRHRESRLTELLNERELLDPLDTAQHALDLASLLFEHVQVGSEDLHVERALQTGLGFVDRVLGGLGVVESN